MTNKKVQEGLGELADMAERDHEVQMARAQLYKLAKYSIKLHDMLKGVSEAEGIEGWQQAKITKASDYISSVYHSLEYDTKFGDESKMNAMALAQAAKESTDPYKSKLHQKLAERSLTKGDYARGSDPMPKAKPGRTKHPLKDKLVGEEGNFKAAYQAGKSKANYNNLGAVIGGAAAMKGQQPSSAPAKPQAQKIKSSVTGAQLGKQLGVSDPNAFLQAVQKVRQGQPINRIHQAAFSDAFQKLMAMDPQDTQRVMMMLKRMEAN